ncbi:MAG: class I SAM-dependent methyltransferase [Thermoleophilaceae bacterium]
MPACPVCAASTGPPVLRGRDRLLDIPGDFSVAECTGCGLALTEPWLEGSALARHYPEEGYEPYRPPSGALGRLMAANRRLQVDAKLRLQPFRGLGEPGRVLDVGCGRGDLAAAFARRGFEACGIEPSESAVEAARALGVDARQGTIEEAPWEAGSFDSVVFNHSLEHVPDPVGALARAQALLRPGGRLAVVVPDWGSRQRRLFGSRWFHLDLPRHLQHFDAQALEEAARRAGLTPLGTGTNASASGLPGSVQYALAGRCVFTGGRLRPALLALMLLYPLTGLLGRASGGDWRWLLAERPEVSPPPR